MHALSAYIACNMSIQYTIRAVPESIDTAIRQRAQAEGKSLNAIAVEALKEGLALAAGPQEFDDLDALVGSWQDDPAFDKAVADFERVDEDAWK
mgnify:CR=1 FL=1